MNFLRSSTGLVALQGILEVSTIRSDRAVNNQLRSYTRGGDRPMHELRVGQRGRDAAEGADVLELRRCGRRTWVVGAWTRRVELNRPTPPRQTALPAPADHAGRIFGTRRPTVARRLSGTIRSSLAYGSPTVFVNACDGV